LGCHAALLRYPNKPLYDGSHNNSWSDGDEVLLACAAARRAYVASMARSTRSNDWGFPRWRAYGAEREATRVRLCDRHGCAEPGNHPAPKSPNSPERWYFCQAHAAEYNRGWNYFEGLSAEEAAEREAGDARTQAGYRQSSHQAWAGSGDGSRSRDEMRALEVLGLDPDAEFEAIRTAWRRLAKESHPDVRPGDAEAAKRFQAVQTAYEVLRAAEERREWDPK
jgi:hypothetical protein